MSIAGNERADDDSDFEFALVGEQELNYEDALLHSSSVFNLSGQGSNPGPTTDQGRVNAGDGAQPQVGSLVLSSVQGSRFSFFQGEYTLTKLK